LPISRVSFFCTTKNTLFSGGYFAAVLQNPRNLVKNLLKNKKEIFKLTERAFILTVHLIDEAKLGGPVHYRYMYPIER
jgi:hypothetical protein